MRRKFSGILMCLALLFAMLPTTANAADYTVINANDSGPGSLRQAILDANASPEADTIVFSPAVTTITVGSELPPLTGSLTIDGSLPGIPDTVVLTGTGSFGLNGLTVADAAEVTLRNLTIVTFDRYGIELLGTGSAVVENCRIGIQFLNPTAAIALGNNLDGIRVSGSNSTLSVVGSNISCNGLSGIHVAGTNSSAAIVDSIAEGNYENGIRVSGEGNELTVTDTAFSHAIGPNIHDGISVDAPLSSESVPVNMTLNGVSIDLSPGASGAFRIAVGSFVNLMLEGSNILEGLRCPSGAEVVISDGPGAGTGTLTATGRNGGAGIGGGSSSSGGNITITSGTVTAIGDTMGAGIGGGDGGDSGSITLSGGVIFAEGGANASDIGPGNGGIEGMLTISGTVQVFLKNNTCMTAATSHTRLNPLSTSSLGSYGVTAEVPSAWTSDFGGYLQVHTLNYDANGGSGLVTPDIKIAGTAVTVSNGGGLTKTGYSFSGWNTASDGSGTEYAAGSTLNLTGNTTLYAQWADIPPAHSGSGRTTKPVWNSSLPDAITILSDAGTNIKITIGTGDKSGLSDEAKESIGGRPLIDVSSVIGGKPFAWSNRNAPVIISIPYTPSEEEMAHLESLVIWHTDGSGNVVTIPNGHYDPATGTVTFQTGHFGNYAVAYNQVSFKDVEDGTWYNKAVRFIAARGITDGTGSGKYSPDAKLTRGEFLVLMMRAYGIAPDTDPADNFTDAGNTYYTNYLAKAKRINISAGIGNNRFAPGKEISRQEMFTLLYNGLSVVEQLPEGNSGKNLSDFIDTGEIETWALHAIASLVETETISGMNGALNPTGTTTRAEMAQVLYNLLGK